MAKAPARIAGEPPRDIEEFAAWLAAHEASLPKRLKAVADFAVAEPDEIAFGTTASIAARAGVQPSTLVRFAQAVGYAGFSELQGLFRERLRQRRPDYGERLETLRPAWRAGDARALLDGFIAAARTSLDRLAAGPEPDRLEAAITALARARVIHVIGQRRAFPVAAYLAYALPRLGVRAVLIDNVGSLGAEQIAAAAAEDALLAISFSPYTPFTVEQAGAAAGRSVPVVAITDSAFSPLARLTPLWLEVTEADFGAFRSIAATMTLAMALAVALAERRSARSGP